MTTVEPTPPDNDTPPYVPDPDEVPLPQPQEPGEHSAPEEEPAEDA